MNPILRHALNQLREELNIDAAARATREDLAALDERFAAPLKQVLPKAFPYVASAAALVIFATHSGALERAIRAMGKIGGVDSDDARK